MPADKANSSLTSLAFASPFRKYSVIIFAAESVTVILGCLSPLLQRMLIDGANAGNRQAVVWGLLALGSLLVGGFLCRSVVRWQRGLLGVTVRLWLKGSIFRHLLALPEEFLRSRGAGYFFNRVQNDIGETVSFIAGNGLTLGPDLLKLAGAFGLIAYLQWQCALLALPFLLLQGWICIKFRTRQYRLAHRLQECVASERHLMQEYLAHHTTMKTHAAGEKAGRRIDQGLSQWGRLMRKRLVHENWFLVWLQVPVWLCCGIVTAAGLFQVLRHLATLGEIWALLGLLMLVFAPARSLGSIFVQMQSARSAWARLQELRNRPGECIGDGNETVCLKGDLVFSDVKFSYATGRVVLDHLNLVIPQGTGMFLAGANGSGKSTLFALLLRLYSPQTGQITIGGTPINNFELEAYRSRIGYIGQHPEFIPGTLRENLLLGSVAHTDSEILELFRRLGCEALVTARPGGLSAPVAEHGENFSGGERLRLALVRELLRDTDWLLFDEAAAHLDQEGRQAFYSLLQKLPGSKTVIAIVHEFPEHSF